MINKQVLKNEPEHMIVNMELLLQTERLVKLMKTRATKVSVFDFFSMDNIKHSVWECVIMSLPSPPPPRDSMSHIFNVREF